MKSPNEQESALMPRGSGLWIPLVAFRSAGQIDLKKWLNSLRFWHRTGLRQLPEVSSSSTVEQSQRFEISHEISLMRPMPDVISAPLRFLDELVTKNFFSSAFVSAGLCSMSQWPVSI